MKTPEYKLIRAAMERLEQMPCGGIGETGATIGELVAEELAGRCYDGDATYHAAQAAWRLLEKALKGGK